MPFVRLAPIAVIAALVVALVRVVAVADSSPSPAPAGSASASAAATSTAAVKTANVKVINFGYTPESLTVPVGTKVTFKNYDTTAHTVTSSDAKPVFDSGDLPLNKSWSTIFAKAGTYKYYCQYHTYMTGTITVK